MQWTVSPNNPSPIRTGAARNLAGAGPNIPCLSPILGSPNKGPDNNPNSCTAVMQWDSGNNPARALTVPENLSGLQQARGGEDPFKRRSAELLQYPGGRNIVLNYGQTNLFERSGSMTSLMRRHSGSAGKENVVPEFVIPPPPALSEETLLAPEHNEILSKLKFVSQYVDTIIDVARCKAAPLSDINDTASSSRNVQIGDFDPSSPLHRRVQQLLLYMRCLHLLSQALDFSRTELKSKRLKPSTTVKNGKTLKGSFILENFSFTYAVTVRIRFLSI